MTDRAAGALPLGIAGRTAIVCGSSRGLGRACADALLSVGVEVVLNARSEPSLREAAAALGERAGRPVRFVAADVTTADGRGTLLSACPAPDILVTNSAGPPPGHFDDWDEAQWLAALGGSMIAPIQLIRAVLGGMRARRWGRIVNITSTAVKAPLPLLGLSTGARAGFTGYVAGLARDVAADGVTVNNLLPGHFDTDRLAAYLDRVARARGIDADAARREVERGNPMRRVGDPAEFGAACAFLASECAGYITGQNWVLDGGAFPGIF